MTACGSSPAPTIPTPTATLSCKQVPLTQNCDPTTLSTTRNAMCQALCSSRYSSSIPNSSPPMRATQSEFLTLATSSCAISTSASSPALCPNASFIDFNPSTSTN